jgi:hypothetical protein
MILLASWIEWIEQIRLSLSLHETFCVFNVFAIKISGRETTIYTTIASGTQVYISKRWMNVICTVNNATYDFQARFLWSRSQSFWSSHQWCLGPFYWNRHSIWLNKKSKIRFQCHTLVTMNKSAKYLLLPDAECRTRVKQWNSSAAKRTKTDSVIYGQLWFRICCFPEVLIANKETKWDSFWTKYWVLMMRDPVRAA